MFFCFCCHGDIIGRDIFGWFRSGWLSVRLECYRVVLYLKYHEGTSILKKRVITDLDVVTTQRENCILWYKDPTHEWKTWKLRHLAIFLRFNCTNPIRTPLTTFMFIPAPATQRYSIIERSFKSNSASRSIDLPRVCPIFNVKIFFCFLLCF